MRLLFITILALLLAEPLSVEAAHAQNKIYIQPTNVTPAQMNRTVEKFYAAWKHHYIRKIPGTSPLQKFVEYEPGPKTVSEAHGYGMVIAAYMKDKRDFDALYYYFKAHPSKQGKNLMAWNQKMSDGAMIDINGSYTATDGDLDIAYALILADKQWGSRGTINYRAAALASMSDTLSYVVNPTYSSLMIGDWVMAPGALTHNELYTRPSDFMTDHILAFAEYDTAHSEAWARVYDRIVTIVNGQFTNDHENAGMVSDFMVAVNGNFVPVTGKYMEGEHDGDYFYNACRTPWRLAMSYINYGRTEMLPYLLAQNRWIRSVSKNNPASIKAGYYVQNGDSGKPFTDDTNLSFIAPFAINAMITPNSQQWLNRLWSELTGKHYGLVTSYYGDAIRMQVLLTLAGKWWRP